MLRPYAFGDRGGWFVTDFSNDPELRPLMRTILNANGLRRALTRLGAPHLLQRSEIYVDSWAPYHFDGIPGSSAYLNQPYKGDRGFMSLTKAPPINEGRLKTGETQNIITVALYLQDHSENTFSSALSIRDQSHKYVHLKTQASIMSKVHSRPEQTLHPQNGDIVVFRNDLMHRGESKSAAAINWDRTLRSDLSKHRIMFSLNFGSANYFSCLFDRYFYVRAKLINNRSLCGFEGLAHPFSESSSCAWDVARRHLLQNGPCVPGAYYNPAALSSLPEVRWHS